MTITKDELITSLRQHDAQHRRETPFYAWRPWDSEPQIAAIRAFLNALPKGELTEDALWQLHSLAFKKVSKHESINDLVLRINSDQPVTVGQVEAALASAPVVSFLGVALGYDEPLVARLRALVVTEKQYNSPSATIICATVLKACVSAPMPERVPASVNSPFSLFNWSSWRFSSTNSRVAVAPAEPEKSFSLLATLRKPFSGLMPWWSAEAYAEKQLTAQVLLDEPTFKVLLGKPYQAPAQPGTDSQLAKNTNAVTMSIYSLHARCNEHGIAIEANAFIEAIATAVECLVPQNLLSKTVLECLVQNGQHAGKIALALLQLRANANYSVESVALVVKYPADAEAIADAIAEITATDRLSMIDSIVSDLQKIRGSAISAATIVAKYKDHLKAVRVVEQERARSRGTSSEIGAGGAGAPAVVKATPEIAPRIATGAEQVIAILAEDKAFQRVDEGSKQWIYQAIEQNISTAAVQEYSEAILHLLSNPGCLRTEHVTAVMSASTPMATAALIIVTKPAQTVLKSAGIMWVVVTTDEQANAIVKFNKNMARDSRYHCVTVNEEEHIDERISILSVVHAYPKSVDLIICSCKLALEITSIYFKDESVKGAKPFFNHLLGRYGGKSATGDRDIAHLVTVMRQLKDFFTWLPLAWLGDGVCFNATTKRFVDDLYEVILRNIDQVPAIITAIKSAVNDRAALVLAVDQAGSSNAVDLIMRRSQSKQPCAGHAKGAGLFPMQKSGFTGAPVVNGNVQSSRR